MLPQQTVNRNGLLIADQGNHTEAHWPARFISLILRLLGSRSNERGDSQRFVAIDLAVAARAGDAVGNQRRPDLYAACVAQGLHAAVIRDRVAELNDFRNAAEMLDQTGGSAEGLARQVIDGDLA